MLKHVANVRPLFLPFKRVSTEGHHIPSATVAIAVTKAIASEKVDTVQATKNGWQIYVRSEQDCVELQAVGIQLAGKHIPLNVAQGQGLHSTVKLVLKDLPLHEVSNEHVLEAVKQYAEVVSEVRYSNIWVNGQHMHL